jgi:dTDP-D-glucose 4,6-dehydratase
MTNNVSLLMRDYAWYETYKAARGAVALRDYINRVYRFLTDMRPGSVFRLEGNVRPENLDLFVKVCCLFIEERTYMPDCTAYYEFNADVTVIRCIRIDVPEKKTIRKKVKPDNITQ